MNAGDGGGRKLKLGVGTSVDFSDLFFDSSAATWPLHRQVRLLSAYSKVWSS